MRTSVIIAFVIGLVAVLWMASGIFKDDLAAAMTDGEQPAATQATADTNGTAQTSVPAKASTGHAAKEAIIVETRRIDAQMRVIEVVLRGKTESVRTVDLMAETSGSVVRVLKKKGDVVRRGDPIASLGVSDREARKQEAMALVKQREIERDAAVTLATKGYKSQTAVAAAEAQLDAARAGLKRVEVEMSHLTIRAPFDGTVAKRHVQLGSFLGIGDPVATIVDRDPILLVGNISEREVGKVAVGSTARAVLVDGSWVSGNVRFIAPTADPATRTFRVEVEVPNPDAKVRDGITAEIRLAAGSAPAHLLTPAILTLNSAGDVGVRVVDQDRIARFQPVAILADGADGVWVSGLPETVEVITVGQEFVQDGEPVRTAAAK